MIAMTAIGIFSGHDLSLSPVFIEQYECCSNGELHRVYEQNCQRDKKLGVDGVSVLRQYFFNLCNDSILYVLCHWRCRRGGGSS